MLTDISRLPLPHRIHCVEKAAFFSSLHQNNCHRTLNSASHNSEIMHFLAAIALLLFTAVNPTLGIGILQSVGVRGAINCNGQPLANTLVRLWDDDSGPNIDELLASGYTDGQGRFQLSGSTSELSTIDVLFKVYHDCDNQGPCRRKVTLPVPSSYVSRFQAQPTRLYDFGSLEVAQRLNGEETDCMDEQALFNNQEQEEEDEYEKRKKSGGTSKAIRKAVKTISRGGKKSGRKG